ncbi:MAG: hypothetical protein H6656_02020 [Ardenticatenaceae bacterium]|nr:hypothetical protein [Ardenticatenaceae bacterium]
MGAQYLYLYDAQQPIMATCSRQHSFEVLRRINLWPLFHKIGILKLPKNRDDDHLKISGFALFRLAALLLEIQLSD